MKQYWVEGIFKAAAGRKKTKAGSVSSTSVEPFYHDFWANSPDEALKMAVEEVQGALWIEGPRICKISEEERMRSMGEPELPLFSPAKKPTKKLKK